MFGRGFGSRASFFRSAMIAMAGIQMHQPPKSKPIELPQLPVGEAPEELRQPLLKGRRGKKSRRERKQK